MAPKKKNNKKADDWESELGETVDPIAAATEAAKEEEAANDVEEESFPATGLMAAMKKNRNKKKNKGKAVDDFGDGDEEPPAEEPDLAVKAAQEATMEDEFALLEKKGKANVAANGSAKPAKEDKDADEEEERGADGKLLSKKEKEKLKKEREKQRKKEQVSRQLHN
jgi:translation initiation factor 5B